VKANVTWRASEVGTWYSVFYYSK